MIIESSVQSLWLYLPSLLSFAVVLHFPGKHLIYAEQGHMSNWQEQKEEAWIPRHVKYPVHLWICISIMVWDWSGWYTGEVVYLPVEVPGYTDKRRKCYWYYWCNYYTWPHEWLGSLAGAEEKSIAQGLVTENHWQCFYGGKPVRDHVFIAAQPLTGWLSKLGDKKEKFGMKRLFAMVQEETYLSKATAWR